MSGRKTKTQERRATERAAAANRAAVTGREKRERERARKKADGSDLGSASGGSRRVFPVFESLGQAAAVLGAPVALLKAAKRKGCKAFISGSRVDAGELIPFLFSMLTEGNDLPAGMNSAAEWLTTEKARRERLRRLADEKAMMPTAEACAQASRACGFFFSELERWVRELPPALAGGTSVDICKRLSREVEGLRKKGQAKFEEIGR